MYQLMNAHALTVIIIIGTIMVTPIYVLGTYVFSGASRTRGMQIGVAFLVFGSLMFWLCLSDVPRRLGLIGNTIVPLAWILPSLILYLRRDWFLSQRLSQVADRTSDFQGCRRRLPYRDGFGKHTRDIRLSSRSRRHPCRSCRSGCASQIPTNRAHSS